MNKKNNKKGFSLMEVLIFSTIMGIFFIGSITVVSYMIRLSKVNEHKIIATRYAQELLSWLDAERDIDWNAFTAYSDPPATYCVNNKVLSAGTVWNTSPCNYDLDSVFKRTVTLTGIKSSGYVSEVTVAVKVQWLEAGKIYNVPIDSTFAVWEQ